ncbi:hypothetical protein ACVXHA_28375 [Escherichia coli]
MATAAVVLVLSLAYGMVHADRL